MPTLDEVRAGGKGAVARALTALEAHGGSEPVVALLDEAFGDPKGHVIGITGPPGAGKSTLIDAMLRHWRNTGLTVAVLAVDPSSQASRGALLGDRVRMRTDPEDSGVFIRSLAARGRLGGLSDIAYPATVLMRAIYDRVIVESVGVGQSEAEIAGVADTVVLCIQPGSGDSLQFMKAGIIEIPDIAVVTKADTGAVASRALADLKGALQLAVRGEGVWATRCLLVSSATHIGLEDFIHAIDGHRQWLEHGGRLGTRRNQQAQQWAMDEVQARFGREGVRAVEPHLQIVPVKTPFGLAAKVFRRLIITYNP